jgi:hypothetical protein
MLWHADFVVVLPKTFKEIESPQQIQPANYCPILHATLVAILQY